MNLGTVGVGSNIAQNHSSMCPNSHEKCRAFGGGGGGGVGKCEAVAKLLYCGCQSVCLCNMSVRPR